MPHLTVFVGDYGKYAAAMPVVGWQGSDLCIWFDHRMTPAERLRFVTSVIDPEAVTSLDRVIVDPAPGDCPAVHDWCHVERRGDTVGATCHRCGAFGDLNGEPVKAYRSLVTVTAAESHVAAS